MSQYTNQGPQQGSSDEIDLREVFQAVGRFFSRIGRGFVNLILAIRRGIRRYRVILLVSVVLFAGLGLAFHNMGKDYYSSRMVIESEYYNSVLMEGAIGTLNELAEEGAYGLLAQKLNISLKEAENLRSFKVEAMMSEENERLLAVYQQAVEAGELTIEEMVGLNERLIQNDSQYRIIVEVFSNDFLGNLQKGIVTYLEENEYVNRRMEVKENNLIALQGKLQQERAKLDDLKGLIAQVYMRMGETERSGSNNVILGGAESATDPLNVFREDIKLYNEELGIKKELALIDNVEVIRGFTAFTRPANLSLLQVVFFSCLTGMGAAFVIMLLLEAHNALNRYEREEKAKEQVV